LRHHAFAQWAAWVRSQPRSPASHSSTAPGTINALVVGYYKSAPWNGLEEETRKTRRRIIEKFRVKHGDKRVALLQREHVERMLAEIERPSAKRHWLKAIRALLQAAVPTMRKDTPTAGIPNIKASEEQGASHLDRCRDQAIPRVLAARHPAAEFALETVSRRGEVVRRAGSTSKAGAFGSSARMAAPMWTFRSRPSCKRPAMLCQRHT
jgi:hypothetical protein